MTPAAERLRKIQRFDQLVAYLRDELDWPMDDYPFEDMTFDWDAEELGIDLKTAAKIQQIKQLRPLASGQEWGIFFVKFEPKQLPVVALRRLLNKLVVKRRASAQAPDIASWQMHDLLFVSQYGKGDHRKITFAHFTEGSGNAIPTLKVLDWDEDDTGNKLQYVDQQLRSCLRWPEDQKDADAWRSQWSAAFKLRPRQVIKTAKELAAALAVLCRDICDETNKILEIETENGPIRKLFRAFQQALIHDLEEPDFADMYAQTITYGLFSAAVSGTVADDSMGSRTYVDTERMVQMVPITNPFLREMLSTFLTVGGRQNKLDFDELGVQEVVELLNDKRTDLNAVLRDFGNRGQGEDPVIHFYEDFLKQYDKKRKVQRGVFYTPKPVVSYIVRSMHELLQTEFGLPDGLADTTTWAAFVQQSKIQNPKSEICIPDGVSPDQPFVQILDPALGTGTFLVEVIEVIYQTMTAKWRAAGYNAKKINDLWNDYVPKHLLPRLYGFELMMAPYAIAHMKIGLKLAETGYRFRSDERARVYLTNSLEPAMPEMQQKQIAEMSVALAHEAKAVTSIKRKLRFTVVIGNPPYSVLSANLSEASRRIVDLYRYVDGKKIEERSMLRLEMHLQDDYVKFLAFSQNLIASSCIGVLGFITNNGYLDNLTLRGVRFALQRQFSRTAIINLHGSRQRSNALSKETDENVFDIEQGVAVFVGASGGASASLQYMGLTGSRERKNEWLIRECISARGFELLKPRKPNYFLIPCDDTGLDEYEAFMSLVDAMPVNISGIVTAHDDLVVDFTDDRLIQNAAILRDRKAGDEEVRAHLGVKDNAGWKLAAARVSIKKTDDDRSFLKAYAYRPFDTRRIYYHSALVWCDRHKVMSHTIAARNLAMATCRQLARLPWEHVFVTRSLQDDCFVSNRTRERSYHFPLYLYGESRQRGAQTELAFSQSGSNTNMSARFLAALHIQLGRTACTVDNVFGYIYCVLHSPEYRSRYAEFLRIDFPRIPLPDSPDLFRDLAHLGVELVALHLMESSVLNNFITTYTGPAKPEVGRVNWSQDTVWLDAPATRRGQPARPGTIGFRGVPEAVWNFHIGGYQVCRKWLKDRKGRKLSKDDIAHYQKIVVALNETIRLMQEIDEVIEQHGGWPGAFASETIPTSTVRDETRPAGSAVFYLDHVARPERKE